MNAVPHSHWAVLSLWAVWVAGCGWHDVDGNGQFTTQERTLGAFTAIQVSHGIAATVVVDAAQPVRVAVAGDDNLVKRVRTRVDEAGTLSVDFRDEQGAGWNSRNPLRIELTVPRLESFARTGGGDVELSGAIASPSFQLSASGGGSVKARGLAVQALTVNLKGGVVALLEGQARQFTGSTSGNVVLSAAALSTQKATLNSSGSGSTLLQVSDSLRVSASGSVGVHILGWPPLLSQELSGSSTLTFE